MITDKKQVFDEITLILCDVLGQKDLQILENTTSKDLARWDSLNHAVIIAEIQKHFKIKFLLRDVMNLKSVGQICDLVIKIKMEG